jgi:hypothetical protein
MPKYSVEISQLRWEYTTVELEFEEEVSDRMILQAAEEAGWNSDWSTGEIDERESAHYEIKLIEEV